ncbi:unnamed protein product [Lampetra planeri]
MASETPRLRRNRSRLSTADHAVYAACSNHHPLLLHREGASLPVGPNDAAAYLGDTLYRLRGALARPNRDGERRRTKAAASSARGGSAELSALWRRGELGRRRRRGARRGGAA